MPIEKAFESPPEVPIALPGGGLHPFWDFWFKQLLLIIFRLFGYSVTHDPGVVSASSVEQQVITVTGMKTNSVVFVNKPTKTAGIVKSDEFASADNQLTFTLTNITGGDISPGEEVYRVIEIRL